MESNFLISWLAQKAFDMAFEKCRQVFSSKGAKIDHSPHLFEQAVAAHLEYVSRWSSEVAIAEPNATKQLNSVYIHLDCYVSPRRERYDPDNVIRSIPLLSLFQLGQRHQIILGHPEQERQPR